MPNVTISVPESLKAKMDEYREVSWSEVCRRAIESYIGARGSVNPVARARFLELREKEKANGYSFGLKLAEELTNQLEFHEIDGLLKDIEYSEFLVGEVGETTWLNVLMGEDIEALKQGVDTTKLWKEFEERAAIKGSLAWLMKLVPEREGFHRNWTFIEGMTSALREVFR